MLRVEYGVWCMVCMEMCWYFCVDVADWRLFLEGWDVDGKRYRGLSKVYFQVGCTVLQHSDSAIASSHSRKRSKVARRRVSGGWKERTQDIVQSPSSEYMKSHNHLSISIYTFQHPIHDKIHPLPLKPPMTEPKLVYLIPRQSSHPGPPPPSITADTTTHPSTPHTTLSSPSHPPTANSPHSSLL